MGDLIANFLTFFQATFFWQVVYGVLSPIWNDVVGRIFILTTFSYLIGFSVYVGYLGYFAGGFGSLSLNRLGIQISDLITLFPSAAITVVRVIQASFVKTFVKICVFVLYHLSAIFIGVIIALGFSKGYARQINEDWTPIVAQAGAFIFMVGAISSTSFRSLKIKNAVLTWVVLWLMETLGIFLFAITIEPSTSNIPINSTTSQPGIIGLVSKLLLEFSTFVFAIYLVFLLPLIEVTPIY